MIRRFMKYYRPYMHILIWVIVGTFVMAGLDLIFPVVVRELIHDVLPAGDMHRLFIGSGILLVLYILNKVVKIITLKTANNKISFRTILYIIR